MSFRPTASGSFQGRLTSGPDTGRSGGGPAPTRGERAGWALAVGVPLLFLGLFFLWPLASIVGRGIAPDGALDLSGFGEVLGRPRTWRVIGWTLAQAGIATVLCVLLGVPGAAVVYRRRFPGRGVLRAVVTVPFVLPTVVVGAAFHAMVTRGGPLAGLFGGALDGSRVTLIAALVFFNYGLVVRTVGTMWSRLDPRMVEAARSLGASPWRAWRTVTLPSLVPAIASAAALTFLYSATAYGLVLVLGGNVSTIETEIYTLTAVQLDLRAAAVLSMVQIGFVLLVLWLGERARHASEVGLKLRIDVPAARLSWADAPALAATLTVAGGLILAPVVGLVLRSFRRAGEWTLTNYTELFVAGAGGSRGVGRAAARAGASGAGTAGAAAGVGGVGGPGGASGAAGVRGSRSVLVGSVWEAAGNSARMAIAAAAIALIVGVAVSVILSRRPASPWLRRGQSAFDAVLMLPLGVSAVTIGFGFLLTLSRPPLELTRSWWVVPLAQAVVAVPLVVRTLVPALRAIDPKQRESAAMLGAGPGRVLWSVDGPHLLRAGGLAAGFALATALGEFGATSFLVRPETPTLPVVLYRLVGAPGAANQGMGMATAVILAAATAGLMLGCELLQTAHYRKDESR